MRETHIPVRGGDFAVDVFEGGDGSPLLFLHGIGGLRWNGCLERLSLEHRVIAPCTPGFPSSTGGEQLQDVHDLIYFYLDLLDELGLHRLPIVGHSFGGMIAAELAAVQPERFSAVVLIAAFGLWRSDVPALDIFSALPQDLTRAMFYDLESPAAKAMTADEPEALTIVDADSPAGQRTIDYHLERAQSLATVARYLFPIPNRGLSKRLHRLSQPALLLWGEHDTICPPAYGDAFQAAIAGARLEIVPEAAHMVVAEQPERVAALIEPFLAGS